MNVLHWLLPIFGIGFVIFFHELGHFMAARAMGVRVEAFSIGFGPRLFGFRRGSTDWKICLIPLGGFVKMAGETPNAPRTGAADEFTSKSVAARSLIISAGVIMNVIFALLALPIAFLVGVPFETPVIGSVTVQSPAWKAGLRGGDRVVSVDGRRTLGFEDVVTAVAIGGDVVSLDLEREGKPLHRDVVSERDPRRGLPVIGVNPTYAPFEIRAEDVDAAEADEGGRAVAAHRYAAGLRAGDEIVSIDGIPISELTGAELTEVKARVLKVLRGGAALSIVMPPLGSADVVATDEPEPFGLVSAGLVAKEIVADSPALAAGLRKGDWIRSIGDREVYRLDEMALALSDAPADAEIIVERGGRRESLGRASAPDLARSLRTDVDYDAVGRLVVPLDDSAAAKAGIRRGDEIVTANGVPLESFTDIRRIDKTVQTATFGVRRHDGDGKVEDIQVTRARLPVNQALLGFERRYVRETVREGFGGSLKAGLDYTVMMTAQIFRTLKRLFGGSVSPENLGGIITIFQQSKESSKIGFSRGLLFMAVISLNLAVINVFPIPVLDGGWLLLLMIERLRGRPVSERVVGVMSWIGLVLILGLMLFVTWNDIRRHWF